VEVGNGEGVAAEVATGTIVAAGVGVAVTVEDTVAAGWAGLEVIAGSMGTGAPGLDHGCSQAAISRSAASMSGMTRIARIPRLIVISPYS
jgi:hypothetical protein